MNLQRGDPSRRNVETWAAGRSRPTEREDLGRAPAVTELLRRLDQFNVFYSRGGAPLVDGACTCSTLSLPTAIGRSHAPEQAALMPLDSHNVWTKRRGQVSTATDRIARRA
jgi:hypothetical protein